MRELDAIRTFQYQEDPVLLAVWKSACHVERDPGTETEEAETPRHPSPQWRKPGGLLADATLNRASRSTPKK